MHVIYHSYISSFSRLNLPVGEGVRREVGSHSTKWYRFFIALLSLSLAAPVQSFAGSTLR